MKVVYVIETRFREDWKAYSMSLNEDNAWHFSSADTEWHIAGACDASITLKRAIGEAQALVCDPFDVRVVNSLTDKPVKIFMGMPAPVIEATEEADHVE